MIFVQASPYHVESRCQHYTVSKVTTDRVTYVAWHGKEPLGMADSASQAQLFCESHEKRMQLSETTQQSIQKFYARNT